MYQVHDIEPIGRPIPIVPPPQVPQRGGDGRPGRRSRTPEDQQPGPECDADDERENPPDSDGIDMLV